MCATRAGTFSRVSRIEWLKRLLKIRSFYHWKLHLKIRHHGSINGLRISENRFYHSTCEPLGKVPGRDTKKFRDSEKIFYEKFYSRSFWDFCIHVRMPIYNLFSTSSSSSSSSSDSDGEVKRSRKKKSKRESPPPRKSKRSPKRSRSRERRRSRDRRR